MSFAILCSDAASVLSVDESAVSASCEIGGDHRRVTAELLAEHQRRCVLQMRAADLHDIGPVARLVGERVAKADHGGNEPCDNRFRRRNVHRRRDHVVRRLRHVDVVVRMDRALRAGRLVGGARAEIRDHLVHVHVELRAAARHPDVQRELVRMAAGEDVVARRDDQLGELGGKPAGPRVDACRGLFDDRERAHELARHSLLADVEVLQRALRLRAPKAVGGHLDFAQAVGLDARVRHGVPSGDGRLCAASVPH